MRMILVAGLLALGLQGCALVTVVDAAVTTAATAAKVGVKTVGVAADIAIPDDDDDKKTAKK